MESARRIWAYRKISMTAAALYSLPLLGSLVLIVAKPEARDQWWWLVLPAAAVTAPMVVGIVWTGSLLVDLRGIRMVWLARNRPRRLDWGSVRAMRLADIQTVLGLIPGVVAELIDGSSVDVYVFPRHGFAAALHGTTTSRYHGPFLDRLEQAHRDFAD